MVHKISIAGIEVDKSIGSGGDYDLGFKTMLNEKNDTEWWGLRGLIREHTGLQWFGAGGKQDEHSCDIAVVRAAALARDGMPVVVLLCGKGHLTADGMVLKVSSATITDRAAKIIADAPPRESDPAASYVGELKEFLSIPEVAVSFDAAYAEIGAVGVAPT